MGCGTQEGPDGETLVALGMAAAIQLSQGRTLEEIGVLATFFNVLGDNMALIAARRAVQEARKAACEEWRKKCCPSEQSGKDG